MFEAENEVLHWKRLRPKEDPSLPLRDRRMNRLLTLQRIGSRINYSFQLTVQGNDSLKRTPECASTQQGSHFENHISKTISGYTMLESRTPRTAPPLERTREKSLE